MEGNEQERQKQGMKEGGMKGERDERGEGRKDSAEGSSHHNMECSGAGAGTFLRSVGWILKLLKGPVTFLVRSVNLPLRGFRYFGEIFINTL